MGFRSQVHTDARGDGHPKDRFRKGNRTGKRRHTAHQINKPHWFGPQINLFKNIKWLCYCTEGYWHSSPGHTAYSHRRRHPHSCPMAMPGHRGNAACLQIIDYCWGRVCLLSSSRWKWYWAKSLEPGLAYDHDLELISPLL